MHVISEMIDKAADIHWRWFPVLKDGYKAHTQMGFHEPPVQFQQKVMEDQISFNSQGLQWSQVR